MSLSDVLGVLTLGLFVVAPLAAAVLVGVLTRGRVRALGVAGFGILVAEGVLGIVWVLLAPQLGGSLLLSTLAGGYSALRGGLSLVAVALLLFAVVVDRGRPAQAG